MQTLSIAIALLTGCSEYSVTSHIDAPSDTTTSTEVIVPNETPETTPPEEDTTPEEAFTDEPPPEDDCTETSDLIYAIDRSDGVLYLFDPTTLSFNGLGRLECGGSFSGSPASMSVSRAGTAYVRYGDNTVYEVDLQTMACTETSYRDGFGSFGMGYATDHADTWRDDLYVANSGELAMLNTGDWSLQAIGRLPSQSELTGNADGELWAFLPLEVPARIAQIDKSDASLIDGIRLPTFPHAFDIDTFAFATWGGDFWLFVRTYGMGQSTDVYQVTPDGVLHFVVLSIGMDIVGAGVSTCAPT
jgi:DNA-binding beta-propeller fold protein YncE